MNTKAPSGQICVCGCCGKTSNWSYGFANDGEPRATTSHGWDSSCMVNAVLCFAEKVEGEWKAVVEQEEETLRLRAENAELRAIIESDNVRLTDALKLRHETLRLRAALEPWGRFAAQIREHRRANYLDDGDVLFTLPGWAHSICWDVFAVTLAALAESPVPAEVKPASPPCTLCADTGVVTGGWERLDLKSGEECPLHKGLSRSRDGTPLSGAKLAAKYGFRPIAASGSEMLRGASPTGLGPDDDGFAPPPPKVIGTGRLIHTEQWEAIKAVIAVAQKLEAYILGDNPQVERIEDITHDELRPALAKLVGFAP